MKFLKDVLNKKMNLIDITSVTLSEEESPIHITLIKRKDLGSFTLHCMIKHIKVNRSLVDLGASFNVMSYRLYE